MPVYEYRCNHCGRESEFTYKTYADYDAAAETRVCPHCGSRELVRLIRHVTVQKPAARNYGAMSSGEMLSVLEGGNPAEVDTLMRQVGQDQAVNDPTLRRLVDNATSGGAASDGARSASGAASSPASTPAGGGE